MFSLRIKKIDDHRMELSLTAGWRIFSGILTLFFGMMFYPFDKGSFSPLIVILFLVSLTALLYTERWVFDKGNRILKYRSGIFPIIRKKMVTMDEADFFLIRASKKAPSIFRRENGMLGEDSYISRALEKGHVTLFLRLKEGGDLNIMMVPKRAEQEVNSVVSELSSFLGIRVEAD